MKQPQLIFDELAALKAEEKSIKQSISDSLKSSKKYQDKLWEFEKAKTDLKMSRQQVEEEFKKELERLDAIKIEVEENKLLTTDVVVSKLIGGELVEVEHKGIKYVAEVSAKFKKVK